MLSRRPGFQRGLDNRQIRRFFKDLADANRFTIIVRLNRVPGRLDDLICANFLACAFYAALRQLSLHVQVLDISIHFLICLLNRNLTLLDVQFVGVEGRITHMMQVGYEADGISLLVYFCLA